MKLGDAIRAFSDTDYAYHRLTQDLTDLLPKGAIFVHDPNDSIYGSISEGCLKLCWTPDGNCYGNLCAGTVIFHYAFVRTDMFERVDIKELNSSFDANASKIEVPKLELSESAEAKVQAKIEEFKQQYANSSKEVDINIDGTVYKGI